MKTWRLTPKKPWKPRTKQPDPQVILVEADRVLVGKMGALVFLRKNAADEDWGSEPNADDSFVQVDGDTVVRVQAAGCYTSCVIVEADNHDR